MGNEVVFALSDIGRTLLEKLRKKAYRHAYLAEHVRRGIAYQIRVLRDQREWNQGRFSKELGKPQSVVSRWEDPSYGKFTIQTLLEIANVYDVALRVRFIPYSAFIRETRDLSTESMKVPSFQDELAARELARTGAPVTSLISTDNVLQLATSSSGVSMSIVAPRGIHATSIIQ